MHVREYIDKDDQFRVAHNGVIRAKDLGMRVGTRRAGRNHYHSRHGMEMTWTAMKWYLGIDVPETEE
jgi:hypothetical protein